MRAFLLSLLAVTACASHAAGPTTPHTSTATSAPTAPVTSPPAPGPRPTVAAELAVPDGHALAVVATAKGAQIYECAADPSGTLAWKLHAPRADLFDPTGAPLGSHFGGIDKGLAPGPYWQASDGSRVHGAKPVSVANPGSIPLLRLESVEPAATGTFANISFVHRLATTGGAAPTTACTAGQTLDVPYTATYYFYRAP